MQRVNVSHGILTCLKGISAKMLARTIRMMYSTVPKKRFYEQASIAMKDNQYEVHLDGKPIRTPRGAVLRTQSEPLAHVVAQEWESQKTHIKPSRMYVTGLTMTAIDNPMSQTKDTLVNHLLECFDSDTIFFMSDEDAKLQRLQQMHWGNLIDWAEEHFHIRITPSSDIRLPEISEESRRRLRHFLSVYNLWSLHGVSYAAGSLKSLVLTLAATQARLGVEEAVRLTLLETDYQTERWGRVEWCHDVEYYELCGRVAAAILFVNLNSTQTAKQNV